MSAFALIVLFLIANRGAYEGYFSSDDLDNLSWTQGASAADFLIGLLSPRYYPHNFRPAGHLFFHTMERMAGLDFRWYVAVLHALHFLNVWLVWRLLRRLDLGALAAGAGALFFAFHIAVFDAYWKPMYVFDVLCTTFCLASLLAYARRRWILSLLFFWLAYKSKEVAIALPAVLACYELWIGERRWKRLAPFVAIALLFGVQALLLSPHKDDDYALRLGSGPLWTTARFYSSKLLLLPYAGLAALALPLVIRDRRLYFGLASLCLFLGPMLLLPGRLFAAYLYTPLVGAAAAFGAIVARVHPAGLAAFFALWLPANYLLLRENRRAALTAAQENRAYMEGLAAFQYGHPDTRAFIYDGAPPAMHRWGIEGALRYLYRRGDLTVRSVEDSNLKEAFQTDSIALLSWDPVTRTVSAVSRAPGTPDAAYLTIGRQMPIWQLGEGWFPLEQGFRWTRPYAVATLRRPADATTFELLVNVPLEQVRTTPRLSVFLNGVLSGAQELTRVGWQTVSWKLPPGQHGPVKIELRVEPEYQPPNDPRKLGVAVGAFGFERRGR